MIIYVSVYVGNVSVCVGVCVCVYVRVCVRLIPKVSEFVSSVGMSSV